MKHTILCVVFVVASGVSAQEAKTPTKSPLLSDGLLNRMQPQFEQIFNFAFDGAQIKLDRKGWGDPPKVQPKLNIVSINNGPPIEALFNQMRTHAGGLTGSSMSVGPNRREISFTGNALSGRVQTSGDYVRMEFTEGAGSQRTLEWFDDGKGAFRIMLSHPDGDLILLQQGKQGATTIAGVISGAAFAGSAPSFLELYKRQRSVMDGQVLPTLQALSIRLIPSASTMEMKRAVLALLTRTPQSLETGKKLIADLDSEKFPTRDKASKQLHEGFEVYKDLIQDRLKDSTISQEAAMRLNKIMSAHPDAQKISQTIAALNLLRDPAYLVVILEEATLTDQPKIAAQLEAATGQRFGADAAAWKRWLDTQKK